MSTQINQRLREFAVALLEQQGSLVEWPEQDESGFAVLPPRAAQLLECPVDAGLSLAADQGGLAVNLAGLFLERAERLLPADTPMLSLKIESLYLKKSAMDEPVARAFGFPNARVRVQGALPQRVEYHFWHFAAAIDSDEKWEDLIGITVNSRTGALVPLPDPMHNVDAVPVAPEPMENSLSAAVQLGMQEIRRRSANFVLRLEERMARDLVRLKSYYDALLREPAERRMKNPAQTKEQVQAKKRAVQLEVERKVAELRDRYALRPSLKAVALVRLDVPALAVTLQVQRRPTEGTCTVYWNAITKELEPLACAGCGQAISAVHFSPALQPHCARCIAAAKG